MHAGRFLAWANRSRTLAEPTPVKVLMSSIFIILYQPSSGKKTIFLSKVATTMSASSTVSATRYYYKNTLLQFQPGISYFFALTQPNVLLIFILFFMEFLCVVMSGQWRNGTVASGPL